VDRLHRRHQNACGAPVGCWAAVTGSTR
jgi:hypothetical protein